MIVGSQVAADQQALCALIFGLTGNSVVQTLNRENDCVTRKPNPGETFHSGLPVSTGEYTQTHVYTYTHKQSSTLMHRMVND